METSNSKKYIWSAGTVALIAISFAAVASGFADMKSAKHPGGTVASITVSGEGEVTAIPDIATVTFTVRESAKTVPEAQKLTEAKITKGIEGLASLNVDKKDTKTLSYTVNPKYENQADTPPCLRAPCPVSYPIYKQVITGYEVAQTVQVKVRKVDQAGEVFGLLGKANITEITGPDFTVDDIEKNQADAKEKAITDAKEKARATAKALGVSLGSITAFSEDNGGYYPQPMYMMKAEASAAGVSRDAVTLPQGESVIKSRVTITYTLD